MFTGSFNIDTIEKTFYKLFTVCCDNHEVSYPAESTDEFEKFKAYMKDIWNEYGDDITEYIYGETNIPCDFEFSDDYNTTKSVLIAYIDFCKDHPDIIIDVETYWDGLIIMAIEANAESIFETEGPCNVYGEQI